jgi:glycosyltransferase involved in cell wall biosynthesis
MRIGFDGACLSNRRGFGRFARRILSALAEVPHDHQILVFVDRPSAARVEIPERFQRIVVDVSESPSKAASADGRRKPRDMLAMGRAMARARLDLVYFPATYSFVPVWNVGRVVVTMHDTLALAHPDLVFPSGKGRLAWIVKEHAAARWADRIVTVSQSSRVALRGWFRLPDSRFLVVNEGPESVFRPIVAGAESDRILGRYGIEPGRRFLLYVGGLSPHKNLVRLVEAFARGADAETKLVLVGDFHDVFHTHVPDVRAAVERERLEDRVLLTGFVPDDELVYLYNRAYALVQPSLMEGFGLPAVEAMACRTPVLSSTAGSLPEVVGDAGLFFEPTDVTDMARAIRRLLADPSGRETLAARALERSRIYDWNAAAGTLIREFEKLVNERGLRLRIRTASETGSCHYT